MLKWTDKIDGIDDIMAEDVNKLAHSIIENENTYETKEDASAKLTEAKDYTDTELERLHYYGDNTIIPSDESYFTVNETGETITGLTDTGKTQTELVIPYKINGKEITTLYNDNNTSILNGATDKITKVILPNSITSIGDNAFRFCSSLTSINIPNSVTSIGLGAFQDCTSLTSINIPNSVTTIGNNAFDGCTNLTIYCEQDSYAEKYAKENNIPVKYTEIYECGGFWGLDLPLIKTITLEKSVVSIDILSKSEGIELQEFTVLVFIKALGDAIESSVNNCVMCLRTNGGSNYFGYKSGYSFRKANDTFAFWHTKIYNKKFALTDLYNGYGSQGLMEATPTQYSSYTSFVDDYAPVNNLNIFISGSDVSRGAIFPQGSVVFLLGR